MTNEKLAALLRESHVAEVHANAIAYVYKSSTVIAEETSPYQHILIVDNPVMGRMLLLDSLMMVSEKDEFIYHECLAHITLLHHRAPKRVMVIGGGDGGTVREVLRHPQVERVTLVEIDRRVIDLCREHIPSVGGALDDPRVEIKAMDAIQFVADQAALGEPSYDIILSDSTDPVGFAEGLFQTEFYNNCKAVLGTNGVFAAQTSSPLFQANECRMAWRNLQSAFHQVRPYWAPTAIYPGAIWSFALAGEGVEDRGNYRRNAAEKVLAGTRYLNPQLAITAFALPRFVQQLFEEAPVKG